MRRITFFGSPLWTGKTQTNNVNTNKNPRTDLLPVFIDNFPWQVIFYPGRTASSLEFYNLERDRFGTAGLQAGSDPSGQRSEMTNSVLRISRIITANKRKQESLNQKTMDTLKSLGYL